MRTLSGQKKGRVESNRGLGERAHLNGMKTESERKKGGKTEKLSTRGGVALACAKFGKVVQVLLVNRTSRSIRRDCSSKKRMNIPGEVDQARGKLDVQREGEGVVRPAREKHGR